MSCSCSEILNFTRYQCYFGFKRQKMVVPFQKGQGYCCIFDFKRVMTFRKCIFCMFYITYHAMIHPMFKWLYLPNISQEVNHLSVYDRYILCRLFDNQKQVLVTSGDLKMTRPKDMCFRRNRNTTKFRITFPHQIVLYLVDTYTFINYVPWPLTC